ncbi:DUF192 domain-containing protein [Neolewinella lacunae]|uniref:DUF192 domain-containing protein n=1 Tax=Neolewinella lacunae TaxID=1517758 RepID=A0A923TE98_9BACT|nr:DUF192 domain-containing protein [Neolewinella lacunae]MBC6995682.1 DUF192 domain-containing protein [Neolewinella lacunae]MDN3636625.1 DUF192 domain-containing protein [Neolewinella lacunae]
MAKQSSSPKRPSLTDKYQPKKKSPLRRYLFLGLLLLALLSFVLLSIPRTPAVTGPRFTDEGDLTIFRSTTEEVLATLDIEIADDNESIVQGLMYRQSMEEDQGMLFIMPATEPQAFWMLNTYIPLDLIFIDANYRIVNIRPDNPPKSLDRITSEGPAAYVLEVNAGFAARHGLAPGDRIAF